jgi:hypothetical protein
LGHTIIQSYRLHAGPTLSHDSACWPIRHTININIRAEGNILLDHKSNKGSRTNSENNRTHRTTTLKRLERTCQDELLQDSEKDFKLSTKKKKRESPSHPFMKQRATLPLHNNLVKGGGGKCL